MELGKADDTRKRKQAKFVRISGEVLREIVKRGGELCNIVIMRSRHNKLA